LSIHEAGLDIEAVSEALGLDRFALMAVSLTCPVAIDFAAAHPDRVSELLLLQGMAKPSSSHLAPCI
jgi:pimeloyl-ACP methyl ester carboxylesterase